MIFAHCLILQALFFITGAEQLRFLRGNLTNGATKLAYKELVTESVISEVNQMNAYFPYLNLINRTENRAKQTLLTSFFYNEAHGHWAELAGALHVNLHNPFFAEVHVLMESPGGSECDNIQDKISEALDGEELSADARKRLICVPMSAQPTYADFFEYANSKLAGRVVVLANTDVAFDDTLGLIDSQAFSSGEVGYVISVQPPPYSAEYRALFGTECNSATRCTSGKFDGWEYGGNSWDVYVFHSPLQGMDTNYLNHFMNSLGGENRAAYQVEKAAKVPLSNPCKHIHAFHWHCSGGDMHAVNHRVDADSGEHAVDNIMPCWDCPGMRLPEGKAPLKDLCAKGSRQGLASTPLQVDVKKPECTFACLSASDATVTGLCEGSDDVDCLISECGMAPHHYY